MTPVIAEVRLKTHPVDMRMSVTYCRKGRSQECAYRLRRTEYDPSVVVPYVEKTLWFPTVYEALAEMHRMTPGLLRKFRAAIGPRGMR